MPDAATLETMVWWAGGGAAIVLGGWAIAWLADRSSPFAGPRVQEPPPVDIPGYEPPGEDDDDWTTPRAARKFTIMGALVGAAMGWGSTQRYTPDDRFQFGIELVAVCVAVFVLLRTTRDIPAVGEPPPDDPDNAHSVRVRNAALKLGAAAFMLALVWLL